MSRTITINLMPDNTIRCRNCQNVKHVQGIGYQCEFPETSPVGYAVLSEAMRVAPRKCKTFIKRQKNKYSQ
jgi:hypothetical protein